MNVADFGNYYVPAVINIMGRMDPTKPSLLSFRLHASEFDKLLGINLVNGFFNRNSQDDCSLSDEVKELFKALAGPHGKAVLKAYRIQKGLEP